MPWLLVEADAETGAEVTDWAWTQHREAQGGISLLLLLLDTAAVYGTPVAVVSAPFAVERAERYFDVTGMNGTSPLTSAAEKLETGLFQSRSLSLFAYQGHGYSRGKTKRKRRCQQKRHFCSRKLMSTIHYPPFISASARLATTVAATIAVLAARSVRAIGKRCNWEWI